MIEELIWGFESVLPKKREVLNPKPAVPDLGWKRPTNMPRLDSAKVISVDLETFDPNLKVYGPGWGRNDGHVVGVAVATEDGFSGYYPIRHREEAHDNFEPEAVFSWLREELRGPATKVAHNGNYDIGYLACENIKLGGKIYDTQTAERLICFSDGASLEETAQRRLGEGKESTELYGWLFSYFGKGRNPGPKQLREMIARIRDAPPRLCGPYAQSDTVLPIGIRNVQLGILEKMGLDKVFDLEMRLMPLLIKMRLEGVRVNVAAAEKADAFLTLEMETVQKDVNHIAGMSVDLGDEEDDGEEFEELNTGSAGAVAKVLDALGIKYPLTEKTQKPSIRAEWLQKVDHPFCEKIIQLQELKKFRSTFIRKYILQSQVNGRVHGTFDPLGALTGRFAAKNPNLQNIPSRNPELASMIRSIFIPDEGHELWMKKDYSSIESRIFAHHAQGRGSEEIRAEYNNNPMTDYHTWGQQMVEKSTGIKLDRKYIKNLNFAKCIAEGQLVLTDKGLVPIEQVTLEQKVWDGIEFVSHDGVIFKGIKKVITHNGLTATPDHKVWLFGGTSCSLHEAKKWNHNLMVTHRESRVWDENDAKVSMRVYDILNAGPRRRFTCSGVLVSNCYGASKGKLARMLGLTQQEAEPVFDAYADGLPFVDETIAHFSRLVQQNGETRTVLGRRVGFDLYEPMNDFGKMAFPFEKALSIYGTRIRRAYAYKATNYTIQGDAAELMKTFLVDAWESGVFDYTGVPRLIIHDEADWSVRDWSQETQEAFRYIHNSMENAVKFSVPIKAASDFGPDWGELYPMGD